MARNRHTNASASAYEALTYDPAGNEVRQFLMDGIWEGLWLEEVGLMSEASDFAVLLPLDGLPRNWRGAAKPSIRGADGGTKPCSLKGSFTCKKEPILSKNTCPPGQRCERPLPGCKFKKTVVLSPADTADSTPVRNPITGTVYNIKWKLTKIKPDVELDMDLYLYGCKGGGCPT